MTQRRSLGTVGLAIAVVCAVSVAGNVLFATVLYDTFVKLNWLRIFPLGFETEVETTIDRVPGLELVSIWGDSRAEQWSHAANVPGHRFFNFAHGAMTSSQLLLQLQSAPITRFEVAIVQIGINDLHPLGAMSEKKAQVLAQLRHNLLAIRDALGSRADVVILTTLLPPGRVPLQRQLFWDAETMRYIEETNAYIASMADNRRFFLLDANERLRDPDGYLAPRFADGDFFLHANADAYRTLNIDLQRVISTALPPVANK